MVFDKILLKGEYNKPLYRKFMRVWIISAVACFVAASAFLFVFHSIDSYLPTLAGLSILFFPVVIFSVFGLSQGACASHRFDHVWRGLPAKVFNLMLLVIYFAALVLFYINPVE